MSLPASAWKTVGWRPGTRKPLRSRFTALRLRPAHRDYESSQPRPEEWLLIEWPKAEAEPTKYWLSTLPVNTSLADLVRLAKQRWIIERDYQELKQELGLGHYEGRGWRGFYHHAYPLHRGLWVPNRRAEPFFPLHSGRSGGVVRQNVAFYIEWESFSPARKVFSCSVAGRRSAEDARRETETAQLPRL